jgi:hypothetical protein
MSIKFTHRYDVTATSLIHTGGRSQARRKEGIQRNEQATVLNSVS